jgi:hypothetical protein
VPYPINSATEGLGGGVGGACKHIAGIYVKTADVLFPLFNSEIKLFRAGKCSR